MRDVKAAEVMRILRITRPTLHSYLMNGSITAKKLPSGRYDYDDESVYGFIGKDDDRKTIVYSRPVNIKTDDDSDNRSKLVIEWCIKNGFKIDMVVMEKEGDSSKLFVVIDDVVSYHVRRVVFLDAHDIDASTYHLLKYIFSKFGTNLIAINSSTVAII